MAFSPNLQINEPTPFDPAQTNEWAGTVNTNMAIIDLAVAGTLSLPVAGNSNVILTSTAGVTSQSVYGNYVFTGVLTGNITVFWPNGLGRKFNATNSTTGAFTLTMAVNNGSGSPAGNTIALPQGDAALVVSDGTNITLPVSAMGNLDLLTGGLSIGVEGTVPVGQAIAAHTTGASGGVYVAEFYNDNDNNTGDARGLLISGGANSGGGGSHLIDFTQPDGTALGSISQAGTGSVAYNTSSDYRLKTVMGEFSSSGVLLDGIPIHLARFTDDPAEPQHDSRPMFLAHEVQSLMPWVVNGAKDAVDKEGKIIAQQIDHSALVPTLWAEIKSLRARLSALESRG